MTADPVVLTTDVTLQAAAQRISNDYFVGALDFVVVALEQHSARCSSDEVSNDASKVLGWLVEGVFPDYEERLKTLCGQV